MFGDKLAETYLARRPKEKELAPHVGRATHIDNYKTTHSGGILTITLCDLL